MKIKMILPALTGATSPLFRPIKYSLFPPLGLATLAAYADADDEVTITDEHVENLMIEDRPDVGASSAKCRTYTTTTGGLCNACTAWV
jgi:hypothetical protein